eukprot:g22020.t1
MIDDGQSVGEVPPGTYTMESFGDKLKFWKRKQAIAIVTRTEDFPIDILCRNLPTAENLIVDATVRMAVQIEDVALFFKNLLGARTVFDAADLEETLEPLVQQALWEAVGRLSITDLTGAEAREQLDAVVEQALSSSMRRYGLRFIQVQLVSVRHEKYDEHRKKLGETWLQKEGLAQKEALNELYSEEELLNVKKAERANELELLAENVAIDRMEGDLGSEIRRIGVRNAMRDAIQSEKFDEITTQEEMAAFLQERDKGKLLRNEEMDELLEGFQQRKEDRGSARSHLVAKLELERGLEIDKVRADLDHAMKLKRLDHEIALAGKTATKDNTVWQHEVELEKQKAEHYRYERMKEIDHQHEVARSQALHRREDEWDDLVQKQRTDRLHGEIEIAQAERSLRLAKVEIEIKKQQADVDADIAKRQDDDQLARMAAIQKMNEEAAQSAHTRDVDKLKVQGTLGTEALIATSDAGNASALADLKKHEADKSVSQAVAEERARLEKEKADIHQQSTAQMQALLQQAMNNMGNQSQPVVVVPGATGGVVTPGVPGQPVAANSGRVLASACEPELLRVEDDRWTFDVPFAMTTGGADCRPGRYRIEVRAAFPHAGGDCPWYYCCTIRLTVGDSSGSDGPTLEIEGDGQSIVNLHGGNLRRFSTIRLKGGDRSIVNLQDPSGATRSSMSETELPELDDAIFEYDLRVDDRRRRLRPIVSVTRPAAYESSGRLSLAVPDGRRIQLITRRKVTLGRTSANEIRTYFLPRGPNNDKLTLGISGVHAAIQLAQDGVVINDEGSRNGVSLAGQKIDVERMLTEADADEDLRLQLASELRRNAMHLELRLFGRPASSTTAELDAVYCDALRLSRRPKLWQLAAASRIDALRLRRLNNLTEEEYVVVYCQATIGSATDAAICLPAESIEHRHARVLAIGDVFWIENLGVAGSVRVGDRELEKREVVPLEEGRPIVVGNETIGVEPFAQLHF